MAFGKEYTDYIYNAVSICFKDFDPRTLSQITAHIFADINNHFEDGTIRNLSTYAEHSNLRHIVRENIRIFSPYKTNGYFLDMVAQAVLDYYLMMLDRN